MHVTYIYKSIFWHLQAVVEQNDNFFFSIYMPPTNNNESINEGVGVAVRRG